MQIWQLAIFGKITLPVNLENKSRSKLLKCHLKGSICEHNSFIILKDFIWNLQIVASSLMSWYVEPRLELSRDSSNLSMSLWLPKSYRHVNKAITNMKIASILSSSYLVVAIAGGVWTWTQYAGDFILETYLVCISTLLPPTHFHFYIHTPRCINPHKHETLDTLYKQQPLLILPRMWATSLRPKGMCFFFLVPSFQLGSKLCGTYSKHYWSQSMWCDTETKSDGQKRLIQDSLGGGELRELSTLFVLIWRKERGYFVAILYPPHTLWWAL